MDYLQALILSIVEGLTEFLPISSTGHLVLTSQLLNIPQTDFVKSFEIIIQFGAILAVVALYWKTLLLNTKLWKNILVAFVPTAVLGLIFYKLIKEFLLGNTTVTLLALLIGGFVLILLEIIYKEREHHLENIENLSLKNAFLIGLFQSISMIPGVSRAAATIIGGLFVGLKRKTAVEFSFFLAIPTMAAATGLGILKTNTSISNQELAALSVGFIGSFITALVAIKFLLRYVQSHTFIAFGVYRIILAVMFWLFLLPKF